MGYWSNKLNSYAELKRIAHEAIRYQDRTKLEALQDAVTVFRAGRSFDAVDYKNSIITKRVYELFNTTVEFDNGSSFGVSNLVYAGVMPPMFDLNNPIVDEARRTFLNPSAKFEDFTRLFKKNEINGFVDFKNAKLGDDFSKISCMLVVSRAMMEDQRFTDLEIAAIIGHEVGHIFSYFATIVQTSYYNMLARATANEILNNEDDKLRARVVKTFLNLTGIENLNMETALETKNKDLVYIHLYNQILLNRANLTGSVSIAERNWERSADEFVGRLGGSEALVTALVKIHKDVPAVFRETGMISLPVHLALEATKVAFVICSPLLGPGGVIIATTLTFSSFFKSDIYDPIEERLKTCRYHLTGELRTLENVKGPKTDQARKRILDDISSVDDMLENIKDKPTFSDLFAKLISPNYRRNIEATEYQKSLESFLNNDLLVAANRLKMRV